MSGAFPLATEHLVDVEREINSSTHVYVSWKMLGENLGLSTEILQVIETDYGRMGERLRAVLFQWLQRNYDLDEYGLPSWGWLAEAVKPIDQALSCAIKERRPSSLQSELPKC